MRLLLRPRSPRDEAERRAFIEAYAFPAGLREKIDEEYEPGLGEECLDTVLEGLRAWFLVCLHAGRKPLGMPSRAVDVAWHQFILFTRDYHDFCERAFGHYLHHAPAATMKEPLAKALRRTVRALDRHPTHLAVAQIPFLFAVDSTLGLDDGTFWSPEEIELLRSSSPIAGDPTTGIQLAGGDGCGGDGCGGCGCGG